MFKSEEDKFAHLPMVAESETILSAWITRHQRSTYVVRSTENSILLLSLATMLTIYCILRLQMAT